MRKILLLLFSLFIISSLTGCSSVEETKVKNTFLINIPSIVGKTKNDVDITLKETGIYDKENKITKYKNGLLDISFINNKAERLTINIGNFKEYDNLSCKKYNDLLTIFNLPSEEPSFSNENITRWSYINDIYEVTCAPSGDKIWYVYINVSNVDI